MKKHIALLLVGVTLLSLCACAKKQKMIDDAWSLSYEVSDYRIVWIYFEDGKMIVEDTTYTDYSASQSGKIKLSSKDTTYDYKLDGANNIIVDGTSYWYTINDEKGYVEFSVPFLGIAKKWIAKNWN